MFMAGMPVFFANMALASWIKFSYTRETAATMTAVMALSLAIFLVAQNRWCAQLCGCRGCAMGCSPCLPHLSNCGGL